MELRPKGLVFAALGHVSDALFDGRCLRALTVVDTYTREALAIDIDQGIKGEQVVEAMARIVATCSSPKSIRVDNGPEFISKALDRWLTKTASRSTSRDRASRPTTRSWSRSTVAYATSA